jgi:hypothetical protein
VTTTNQAGISGVKTQTTLHCNSFVGKKAGDCGASNTKECRAAKTSQEAEDKMHSYVTGLIQLVSVLKEMSTHQDFEQIL